jgi:hypothetical protein
VKQTTDSFKRFVNAELVGMGIDDFMGNYTEFLGVDEEYLIDSYAIGSTFMLIEKVLPLALAAGIAKHRILLNLNRWRWAGLDGIIREITDQRVRVVSHSQAAFCWRNTRMVNDINLKGEIGRVRTILMGNTVVENTAFYNNGTEGPRNIAAIREAVSRKFQWTQGDLGAMGIREKINIVARAKLFISSDDGNEIANAIWLSGNSTVIVLLNETDTLSGAVHFLEKNDRKVFVLPRATLTQVNDEYDSNITTLTKIIDDL